MCNEERDSAQLERDLLNNRFKHLESELESEKSVHTERTREVRSLEVSVRLSGTEASQIERAGHVGGWYEALLKIISHYV